MAANSPSLGFLAVIVVVVVAAAGAGVGVLYLYNHPKTPASPLTVAVGDNVTVNYIGLFGSGAQLGKVFDTSIKSVATDNAEYPKSLQYAPRNASGYTPLPVHVGPHTPSSGYNNSGVVYGGVVTGFWKGLIGLAVNQSRAVTVLPYQGYGPLNQSCLRTAPLTEQMPALRSFTPSSFARNFTGVPAATGAMFLDPTFGWTDTVVSANASAIVVQMLPQVGQTSSPYGWTIVVTAVTSSTITITSQLTPASEGTVLGSFSNVTICSTTKFLIQSVNLANGTFVENYNREVVGQTLIFIVTVVSIKTP